MRYFPVQRGDGRWFIAEDTRGMRVLSPNDNDRDSGFDTREEAEHVIAYLIPEAFHVVALIAADSEATRSQHELADA
jgi:hypothetical protein